MGYTIHVLAIVLGLNLFCCDATVNVSLINRANGEDTLECGSDGVVSCRINPYANLINWEVNGLPFVTCSPGCIVNPSITRNYSPTYDVINGVFNLTVDNVTFNDDGTTFICDDGSLSDSISIEVVPAYSKNKTRVKDTDREQKVEFTTTCIQPGVEFEWFTIKTESSDRKTYNNEQYEMTETTECSLDTVCGGVGTGKVSSVITIPKVPVYSLEEKRYIEVVVKYKNPDKERIFRFNGIFIFEVRDCLIHCGLIIFLIYLVRWILLVILYFVGTVCGFWKNSLKKSGLVCIGNIPILGTCLSAFLLFHKRKELFLISVLVIVCCFFDIVLFVVMMLTCSDIIVIPCFVYARVYACVTLIFSLVNCVCLAKYLETQTDLCGYLEALKMIVLCKNKRRNEVVCGKCKQQQTDMPAVNKCNRCDVYLCEKCSKIHTKDHEVQDAIEKCRCSCRRNNAESFCLTCEQFLCKWCVKKHAQHRIFGYCQKYKNCETDYFKCSRNRNNAESYCLTCEQYLCKWCETNHAKHRILRHCQKEEGEPICEIFCNLCEKNIETDTKYYSNADESIVCEDCTAEKGLQDIIAIDDLYFHSENNVESYCLKCQQYLCSLCFTKHAEHRILRHSQQGAPRQILCKYCQNKGIKADAKFYSIGDKSFVCEVCKVLKHLQGITAVKGHEWICTLCKEKTVECKEMIHKRKLCAACFEHKLKDEGRTDIVCALHSGLSVKMNDANELPTDVLCLVCDEHLCKMCFKQHLNLKQRLLQQHPYEEMLGRQKNIITTLLLEQVSK